MATRFSDLYEQDFYAWTKDQAAALRRLAAERWNGPLDLEHLAEEVEDLGSEQRWAVGSQLRRIIEHLLKLEYSAHADPRQAWRASIIDARAEIEQRLTKSIRQKIEPELPKIYTQAHKLAAAGLAGHGEREAAKALPTKNPYPLDDLLRDDWYPANRHGLVDEI